MGIRGALVGILAIVALSLTAGLAAAQTPATPDSTIAPAATSPADSIVTPPAPTTAPAPAAAPATAPPPAAAPAATATQATPPPAAQTAPPPTTQAQAAPPPPTQSAQPAGPSGPFDKGRTRLSFTAGWGRTFDDSYMLLGLGLGRYLTKGVELGLYYQAWAGADPFVQKLTPQLTYVMTRAPMITPYLGAFYTRTWVEGDSPDLDSWGGRAGIFRGRGRTTYGVGAVFEQYLSYDEKDYEGDSWTVYPEVFISASF